MTILLGFILPALIGTINKHVNESSLRFWISAIVCALVGIIVNLIEHNGGYTDMTWLEVANSIATSIMAMIGIVKISYEAIWNNPGLDNLLSKSDEGNESLLTKLDLKAVETPSGF